MAVASVAVNFATAIAILWESCRLLGEKVLSLVAAKKMGRYIALLLVLAVPALVLRHVLVSVAVPSLIVVCLVSVFYLGVFYGLERKDLCALLVRINRLQ